MKRLVRMVLEKLLEKVGGSRRYRHHDEDRYGWQGRNRDRYYREERSGKRWKSKAPKALIAKLRRAF